MHSVIATVPEEVVNGREVALTIIARAGSSNAILDSISASIAETFDYSKSVMNVSSCECWHQILTLQYTKGKYGMSIPIKDFVSIPFHIVTDLSEGRYHLLITSNIIGPDGRSAVTAFNGTITVYDVNLSLFDPQLSKSPGYCKQLLIRQTYLIYPHYRYHWFWRIHIVEHLACRCPRRSAGEKKKAGPAKGIKNTHGRSNRSRYDLSGGMDTSRSQEF